MTSLLRLFKDDDAQDIAEYAVMLVFNHEISNMHSP